MSRRSTTRPARKRAAAGDGALRLLQKAFEGNRLEILVGAGPSIAAGLPGWNELNERLLKAFLAEEYGALELSDADRFRAARTFIERLGREAVVDLVRLTKGTASYVDLLRSALYGDAPFELSDIHYELAAAIRHARDHEKTNPRIYTFNFDPLLEEALTLFLGHPPQVITEGSHDGGGPQVIHLHGYLPFGSGPPRGRLVLSERDYHEAQSQVTFDWAERRLQDILWEKDTVILLVGMSLTDSRLRRVLLSRVKELATDRSKRKSAAKIVVILPAMSVPEDAPLVERLGGTFLRQYEKSYWDDWRIQTLFIESYNLIPHLLRRIRLGDDPARWAREGAKYLTKYGPPLRVLYDPEVQGAIRTGLRKINRYLRDKFGVGFDERLRIGIFIPNANGCLQLACASDELVDEALASRRQLEVDLHAPQGPAGAAFVQGTIVHESARLDRNFTPWMREEWPLDYASALCVPIMDGANWVPIGTTYVTSTQREPFWSRLHPKGMRSLTAALRTLFREALDYRTFVDTEESGR